MKNESELRKLICESIDQSMCCESMLEIQDIDFRVVRIEKKLDKKLLRIWEVVKEIREILVPYDGSIQ